MLVSAASQLGVRTHIFAPDATNSPAGDIAHDCSEAVYDDLEALAAFASKIDAVTSEFENVPASAMAIALAGTFSNSLVTASILLAKAASASRSS